MTMNLEFSTYYPDQESAPERLVFFLHGYGANGADLLSLAPKWAKVLPKTMFLAPNAPHRCPGLADGYMWFDLPDLEPDNIRRSAQKILPAVAEALRAEQKKQGIGYAKTALVGFSQGAMMSLGLGVSAVTPIATAIISYAGMLVAPLNKELKKPCILLDHGQEDTVLPCDMSDQAYTELKAHDYDVTLEIEPGLDHAISPYGARLGQNFLKKHLIG